jgi:hypothetical protein
MARFAGKITDYEEDRFVLGERISPANDEA